MLPRDNGDLAHQHAADEHEKAQEHRSTRSSQSHCEKREAGNVELVGCPLYEIEALEMLDRLPDRRQSLTNLADIDGRYERGELREEPQRDGEQAHVDDAPRLE